MRKTSIRFSDAVNNINKLTHDERAELITEVMYKGKQTLHNFVLLRSYLRQYAIILNMSDDGEDITYLLDGRFVIEDFEDKLTIKDHKVFIF